MHLNPRFGLERVPLGIHDCCGRPHRVVRVQRRSVAADMEGWRRVWAGRSGAWRRVFGGAKGAPGSARTAELAANLATAARADPDLHPSPAVPAGQQRVTLRTIRPCLEKSPRPADCKGRKTAGDCCDDNPKCCAELASHQRTLLQLRAHSPASFQGASNYRLRLSASQAIATGISRARGAQPTMSPCSRSWTIR